ncbi:MAG: exodeoxyribonuclease V subunit gamma, partial [Rubrivivax sp.]|nr:exodeoxyribonuclease V subunit gamma [Rubrivivax sp.]
LQQPMVARRLGLEEDDLAQVHRWLSDAGYHWGLSSAHRAHLGLPASSRHTLAQAMARLFLGHALPASAAEPFGDLLPCGDAEGSRAPPLGSLWQFARSLQTLQAALQTDHPPARWLELSLQACDDFLAADTDTLDDLRELQDSLRELGQAMSRNGLDEALTLSVWQTAVAQVLDDPARGGVPTGRVTFAAMPSLRSLPFAVVALLGLDDGAVPGGDRPAEFDLMAAGPRRGDRQRRQDDRNLFLDLLLAARTTLHLSHSGRSVRDNSPRPPSVLVAELLDTLLPAATTAPDDERALTATRARLCVEHPLQPFAASAFGVDADPRLRSHDADLAQALRQSLATPARIQPPRGEASADNDDEDDDGNAALPAFFVQPLPPPEPAWQQPRIEQLAEFFAQPSRYLLRRRMGLALWQDDTSLDDVEPFTPDRRARRALAARLMPAALAGAGPDTLHRLAEAGTEWPGGELGALALEAELGSLQSFAAQVIVASSAPTLPPVQAALPYEFDGEAWQVQAAWTDLRGDGLLRWRADETRAADRLEAWLQHLALCAAAPPGVALRTRWLLRDGLLTLRAPDEPQALLRELLTLYRRGLREPLPFFARSAWEFVTRSLGAARTAWQPSARTPYAEGADAAHRLAWRGRGDPLGSEFEAVAHAVYDPLIAHLEGA